MAINSLTKLEENISDFIVIAVPADDLAPVGARSSAGTVMTEVWVHYFYTGMAL